MKIKFKNKHFLPLGKKPNVKISNDVYNTHDIVIFDNNFCLISKELKNIIEPIDLNIFFEYDYKTVPNQEIFLDTFLYLKYKIQNKIFYAEDILENNIEYLPQLEIDEESLFYLKLNKDLLEIIF